MTGAKDPYGFINTVCKSTNATSATKHATTNTYADTNGRTENMGKGEFHRRAEGFLRMIPFDDHTQEVTRWIEEAKREISEATITSRGLINLGDYVLVEKRVLTKWFGDGDK